MSRNVQRALPAPPWRNAGCRGLSRRALDIARLGKRETPVSWSENEDFIRRLWPDGTWQLPIDPSVDVSERVWDVRDGKKWVGVRRETTEQRIAKRNAEMDQCARWKLRA